MFDHLFYCPHGGTAALVEAHGTILIFVLPKGLPETAVKSLLCGDQKAGGDKGRRGHDGTSVAEAGSIAESARGESS